MSNLKLRGIVFLAVGLIAGSASADRSGPMDVPAAVSASDLIVVGRANGITFAMNNSETFLIRADRVLKGASAAAQGPLVVRLDSVYDINTTFHEGVNEGQYGIFLLRRPGPYQPYTAVDPDGAAILLASPAPDPDARNSVDPLSGVSQELARVLTTPGSILLDPATGVRQALLVAPPAEQLQSVYQQAASALASVPYQAAAPQLNALVKSESPSVRLWAFYCLLGMKNADDARVSALQSILPILLNPPPDLAGIVELIGSTMYDMTSPKAIPQLIALLDSSEPAVHRNAANDLREIGTPAVIAPLAKLLHDQDADVRYYAAYGLTKATTGALGPSRQYFNENEKAVLDFWDSWVKANVR